MFDDILSGKSTHTYDASDEYSIKMEPELDKVNHIAAELGIPLIAIAAVMHNDEDSDIAQMGVAVSIVPRQIDGPPWMPEMMEVLGVLITNPKMIHALKDILPEIKRKADREFGGESKSTDDWREARDALFGDDEDDIDKPSWLSNLLGDDDET